MMHSDKELSEWVSEVDEVSAQIKGIIDGTITDFATFDEKYEVKQRAKQIRQEELVGRRNKFFLCGREGKGEGERYKWWCKRCFVEYLIDLPNNTCTRCKQSDKMMTQPERREELMGKLDTYKKTRVAHAWRKDKWLRWKKSQALLGKSRNINYKAWEYWEPDTDTEDEGDPIVPRDNPEFMAMEADIKERHRKADEKAKTAERCRQRGNQFMKESDYVGAIEQYDEGLEYKRDNKALWTNKALAELKVFRWHDAIASCNKVIEYTEIFEDGFSKSADACFKAFTRRAAALRALHRWAEAVEDLEDALKLFPKDKEAKDLLEKTRAALAESSKVEALAAGVVAAPPVAAAERAIEEVEEVAFAGPVRIEIEEESSEDEEEQPQHSGSHGARRGGSVLATVSRKDYQAMLKSLGQDEAERVRFCTRKGAVSEKARREDTRKVDLKQIEELFEPSKLDETIKDAEHAAVLWKRIQGKVVPLRSDVKQLGSDAQQAQENRETLAYLDVIVPRVLGVLHFFAAGSDHHCALTAPAVRHIWPMLTNKSWRQAVLELLMEWSQRSISAKTMAEFAGRYPDPHLKLLVEALTIECKENMLPPGLEDQAKLASERLGREGGSGLDSAFEDMMRGLSKSSPSELAVSTLGNLCLAGQGLPIFKDAFGKFQESFVIGLSKQLKAMNWRLCGRSAGAVCNVLRLGDAFASTVEEKCAQALVKALQDDIGQGSSEGNKGSSMMKALRTSMVAGGPLPSMPGFGGSAARLLAALVNLITVRPTCTQQLVDLGLLDVCISLMDAKKAADIATVEPAEGDETPEELCNKAWMMTARMLTRSPAALSQRSEGPLLKLLFASLDGGTKAAKVVSRGSDAAEDLRAVERVELSVRMLAVLLTKTPGALSRLADIAPRCEEVDEDTPVGRAEGSAALPVAFEQLSLRLLDIALACRPLKHVLPDESEQPISRLRGNLAVLLGALCDAQSGDNAPPALRELDLSPVVEVAVDMLRKERGAVQNNIGVFVTKLAQNSRYKQDVRDAKGLESLHQIQLPRVQAQKSEAVRQHRIANNTDARRAETERRKNLRGLD